MRLPACGWAAVVVDLPIAFRLPLVVQGGEHVEDLIYRLITGDSIARIAGDSGIPYEEVQDLVVGTIRAAA